MKQGFPEVCEYKVLVECTTYNHSKYIEDTLKGFSMQQTNFPFVCCVYDDASTDGEQDILKQWISSHCNSAEVEIYDHPLAIIYNAPDKDNPNCIYAIHLQKINTWKNPEKEKMMNYWKSQAVYVAICEGDDFWTEPQKLQKQVDFLDDNPKYSFCCHRFKRLIQEDNSWEDDYASMLYKCNENLQITRSVFFSVWLTQPLTVLYRTKSYFAFQKKLSKYKYCRDVHLFYHLLRLGKGVSLNEIMGVYRIHSKGIASGQSLVNKYRIGFLVYWDLYKRNIFDLILLRIARGHFVRYRKLYNRMPKNDLKR